MKPTRKPLAGWARGSQKSDARRAFRQDKDYQSCSENSSTHCIYLRQHNNKSICTLTGEQIVGQPTFCPCRFEWTKEEPVWL